MFMQVAEAAVVAAAVGAAVAAAEAASYLTQPQKQQSRTLRLLLLLLRPLAGSCCSLLACQRVQSVLWDLGLRRHWASLVLLVLTTGPAGLIRPISRVQAGPAAWGKRVCEQVHWVA
jgi:hypothetical protein